MRNDYNSLLPNSPVLSRTTTVRYAEIMTRACRRKLLLMFFVFAVALLLTVYLFITRTNRAWILMLVVVGICLIEVFNAWLSMRFYRQFIDKYRS